jgi:hypothetical protein
MEHSPHVRRVRRLMPSSRAIPVTVLPWSRLSVMRRRRAWAAPAIFTANTHTANVSPVQQPRDGIEYGVERSDQFGSIQTSRRMILGCFTHPGDAHSALEYHDRRPNRWKTQRDCVPQHAESDRPVTTRGCFGNGLGGRYDSV